MLAVRSTTQSTALPLETGWEFTARPAAPLGDVPPLLEADLAGFDWQPALVPGTVASAKRAAASWSFDSAGEDFDLNDYWYRCRFAAAPSSGETSWLCFDGLATLADVWLNGRHILRSDNMFVASEVEVTGLLAEQNELSIRFASVATATQARRPRPRFRTRMVDRQQLRFIRTTFLGRMPGWSPPAAPVGPWRPIRLERRRHFSIETCRLRAALVGDEGVVSLRLAFAPGDVAVSSATLCVGDVQSALSIERAASTVIEGTLSVPHPSLWWPRPYGEPHLYPVTLELTLAGAVERVELGPIGFRSVSRVVDAPGLQLSINGTAIKAFGACWTPPDVVSLHDASAAVATVKQASAAGMNMLRVGGTMVYECDAFYDECDRAGIMVWQDFMFANCDYPRDDSHFRASVEQEAEQLLSRLAHRPCLTVLCGGSEVEQQISMLGLPREQWQPALFDSDLREQCRRELPELPYFSSSPTGGSLPFQADAGVTHYYGVGAYLRPLEDARRAEVRFASECLAFANVPEQTTLDELLGDVKAPFHEPRWKQRVPRDNGAGWDFDDVRDHYVRALFGVDPMLVRYQDRDRALALARVASGEVMYRTLLEWRRKASSCHGALIWLLRDLWPGAGWGLIDARGRPKAAYYYVKRALSARAIVMSDEGVNGLRIEVVNAAPTELRAKLELRLWRAGSVLVAEGARELAARGSDSVIVDASQLFDHFIDLTHAYRFGPAAYEVAAVRLCDLQSNEVIAESCFFPSGLALPTSEDLGVSAELHASGGQSRVRLTTERFAQAVAIEVPGYIPDDSYFDLSPGAEKWVSLTAEPGARAARGSVRPLNSRHAVRIVARDG